MTLYAFVHATLFTWNACYLNRTNLSEPGVWIRKGKEQAQGKKYSPKVDKNKGAQHIEVLNHMSPYAR